MDVGCRDASFDRPTMIRGNLTYAVHTLLIYRSGCIAATFAIFWEQVLSCSLNPPRCSLRNWKEALAKVVLEAALRRKNRPLSELPSLHFICVELLATFESSSDHLCVFILTTYTVVQYGTGSLDYSKMSCDGEMLLQIVSFCERINVGDVKEQ